MKRLLGASKNARRSQVEELEFYFASRHDYLNPSFATVAKDGLHLERILTEWEAVCLAESPNRVIA